MATVVLETQVHMVLFVVVWVYLESMVIVSSFITVVLSVVEVVAVVTMVLSFVASLSVEGVVVQ